MPSANTERLLESPPESMRNARTWPEQGPSRVPNWVYTDPDIFARETERIFGANDWLYVCLEAEIPNSGDFQRSQLGPREVVADLGVGLGVRQRQPAELHVALAGEPVLDRLGVVL